MENGEIRNAELLGVRTDSFFAFLRKSSTELILSGPRLPQEMHWMLGTSPEDARELDKKMQGDARDLSGRCNRIRRNWWIHRTRNKLFTGQWIGETIENRIRDNWASLAHIFFNYREPLVSGCNFHLESLRSSTWTPLHFLVGVTCIFCLSPMQLPLGFPCIFCLGRLQLPLNSNATSA